MNILPPNKPSHLNIKQITQLLERGKIGVMPTDTIYGILGSALNPQVVEKIYQLRKRSLNKPMIILISSLGDLKKFGIKLNIKQQEFLEKNWPNPLSVVLPVPSEEFKFLHRGTNSLAFRMPKNEQLLRVLKNTGPLVAPSANIEGDQPAENIDEAKKYFGNKVSFYLDVGTIHSSPSTLVEFKGDSINTIRQGSYSVVSRRGSESR